MKWVSFLALVLLASCASEPLANDGWVDAPAPPVAIPTPQLPEKISAPETKSKKPLTGKVTFIGLSAEALEMFRVIPESGTQTFIPKNQHYGAVDGFWWSGDDQRWFKIPDHTVAWVIAGEAEPPVPTSGVSRKSDFTIHWKTIPGLTFFSGRSPGWFPNSGNTQIGVANPF